MSLSPQLQNRLDDFAKSKGMSTEEAIEFILTSWLRDNPVRNPNDDGMTPDELNASNNG